ncbi:MAG: hypothetical protein HN732_15930, partial [Rhodospirillaceae bacterium]|nr:hypothetical protein [Rhodospirillaceae bacterium]
IYSTFATLIFFMIWLYVGWLILLVGANIGFYVQHPTYLRGRGGSQRLSHRAREKLALTLTTLIAQHYYQRKQPWSAEALSAELRIQNDPVLDVLSVLEQAGVIKATADTPQTYLPARPFELVSVDEVLAATRHGGDGGDLSFDRIPGPGQVDDVLHAFEAAAKSALAGQTVKDLALANDPGEET